MGSRWNNGKKINKYPDGTSYVEVSASREVMPKVIRVNSYEDLWHLNQYVDAYYNQHQEKPKILLPNLIDAQADKRFEKNQSSGLKLVCQFLNQMNADFMIYHPHNAEVVEALMDNVEIIDNTFFIKEVLSEIYCNNKNIERDKGLFYHTKNELYDNVILFSSDAGGFKPLMKLCDKINWQGDTLSAVKHRYWNNITKKSELTQLLTVKDLEGKNVLIIDDICVYGGTFKGLSKMLKVRNCGKLYLAVSHMTVQDLGKDPVTNYFDKVFTTNSKYDEYFVEYDEHYPLDKNTPKNLEIIKMFEL